MTIKIGRFTAGVLAAIIAAAVMVVSVLVLFRLSGRLASRIWWDWREMGGFFLAVTGAVFWVGERYGLIADPYRSDKDNPLSLK